MWKMNPFHSNVSVSSLNAEAGSSSSSLYRSSANESLSSNHPAFSRTSTAGTPKRLSGTFVQSPLMAAAAPALPILPTLMPQNQNQRGRAASAVYPSPVSQPMASPSPTTRAFSTNSIV